MFLRVIVLFHFDVAMSQVQKVNQLACDIVTSTIHPTTGTQVSHLRLAQVRHLRTRAKQSNNV